MKQFLKRGLALLLVLAMVVGFVAICANAVTIDYVTGDPEPFNSTDHAYTDVIANWGTRGTTATYLSQNAEAFYAEGSTYADLAAMEGTSTTDATASELYAALHTLMESQYVSVTTSKSNLYGYTRPLYAYTDCENSDTRYLSTFYSGQTVNSAWDSGVTYTREHVWPDAKGMEGLDESDIMLLRPEVQSSNSSRGKKAYGNETTTSFFYPNGPSNDAYDVRGDAARTLLYVYVRWQNPNIWYVDDDTGVIESLDVLLDWMEADPVDTWELGRNDSVQSITGTRNVFVDYPELAFLLFNREVPSDMITPSGEAMKDSIGYTVTAVSSDESMGSVHVNGNTVTALPKTGYTVTGCTVTSGEATVTQNGTIFTVTASADCAVAVQFAPRSVYTVTFAQAGVTVATQNVYSGDSLTLPGYTGSVPEGYTFLGWTDAVLVDGSTAPAVLEAGTSYTPSGSGSLYALYTYTTTDTSGASTVYELYTGTIEEGNYLIVSDSAAMNAVISGSRFTYSDVTVSNSMVDSPDALSIWYIASAGDGCYTFFNASSQSYASGTGASNKGKLVTTVDDYAKWTISIGEDGSAVIENVGNKAKNATSTTNYTLRRNGSYGFAPYSASTGTAPTLYKQSTLSAHYSTYTGCTHANASTVNASTATCAAAGYTGDLYCADCGTTLRAGSVIDALPHQMSAYTVTKAPTATESGEETAVCGSCGYTDARQIPPVTAFTVPADTAVTLSGDITTETLVIPSTSTLDLNGYTLTVSNLLCFGDLTDGTAGGTGRLRISNDPSQAVVVLQSENSHLPIYDTAEGCYRFYAYEMKSLSPYLPSEDTAKFGFRLLLTNASGYDLLQSTTDSGMALQVELAIPGMEGLSISYNYEAQTVKRYAEYAAQQTASYGEVKTALTLTVNGITSLSDGQQLDSTFCVQTNAGMCHRIDPVSHVAGSVQN